MDKDKNSDINHAQGSWVEMHQFIGELLTSGNLSKNQPNSAWGVTPGLGFKSTSLQPLQTLRPVQDKRHENRAVQPGTSQRREDRGEGLDVRHACTCPSCPFSSPPSSFETLRARQPLPTSQFLQASCQPEDLRHSVSAPDTTTTTSSNSSSSTSEQESSQPPRDDSDRRAQNQNSDNPPLRTSSGSLSHLSLFPCLCCHRSLQTCTQLLNQQGTDSPFSHTHHHFHHHHCPLTSCVPCPQIAHSAQLSAPIPCLSCQCSIPVCPQVCQHQHRQVQHREERSRNSTLLHPCMHCTASFSRPSQLLQHQRSEHAHKLPGFLCTECGRSFNSHSNLRIHLNVHTGARPYSCTDCGKCFSQSGALKIHRRIHTGERPYLCGFCGRGFPHLAGVRAHQRIHTGEKPFSCEVCEEKFTRKTNLDAHMTSHTGRKQFGCDACGQKFAQKKHLDTHVRIHTGEKPFSCDVCEQKFTRNGTLSSHMKIHTGQKPFGCEVCEQRFNRQANLDRHRRVHTGQKPFGCGVCGKRFSNKSNLKPHMKIHMGQKEFSCNVCEQKFVKKINLNTHMRTHTGRLPIKTSERKLNVLCCKTTGEPFKLNVVPL
uniref:C2H2-type domain-containing protein n=1 Tax=Iconisemion striatum TaxID=60296 RepID=A0A1A7YSV2_9TELE